MAGAPPADFTLAHAGRQVRIGPVAFWIVVGTLVIMAGWSLTTATYFAFREDVLARLMARQAEMQFGYEDRISELRTQVDRLSSRQLLDQEQIEQKLEDILRRQATLESRAAILSSLPGVGITGSLKSGSRAEPGSAASSKPMPIAEPPALRDRKAAKDVQTTLARVQSSLDRIDARQQVALSAIEEAYEAKAKRMRSVLIEAGVDAGKVSKAAVAATGGPFIAPRPGESGVFERQLSRVRHAHGQIERLARTLGSVPLRKPLAGEPDLSSGFGVRMDPFLRQPAMHTGLDMQADTGEAVRATANGTVSSAGWQGGYGKMVEIDHGNGLSTRYGHLSAIEVKVGQAVKIGQIVGRVGSTGRSTGPHLHYETRVDGDAVDPQRFLRAGAKLGSL